MNKITLIIFHLLIFMFVGILLSTMQAIAQKNEGFSVEPGVEIKFRLDTKNTLSLDIINTSNSNKTLNSNIEGLFSMNFMGFPRVCLLQFKSAENLDVRIKDQMYSEWIKPSTYSSTLVTSDKFEAADVISKTVILAHSFHSYPIQYADVFKLVSRDLTDSKPHQFRVKCRIKLMTAGLIESKEIVSAWFLCGKAMNIEH